MADNVFSRDPFTQQLDQEEARLAGSTPPGTATTTAPRGGLFDPFTAKPHFEEIARQTQVPVNVLMALTERDGAADAEQGIANANLLAQQLAPRLAAGEDIRDIAGELAGSPEAKTELLTRAREIGAQLYGDEYAKLSQAEADKGGDGFFGRMGTAFDLGESQAQKMGHEFTTDLAAAMEEGALGRALFNLRDKFGMNPEGETPESRAAEIREKGKTGDVEAFDKRIAELQAEGFRVSHWSDVRGLGSALSFIGENLATSLPHMGAMMASGPFQPVTGMVLLGGEANEELKEKTDLPESERVTLAAGAGVAMWALENFGLGAIFGKLAPSDIAMRAMNGRLATMMAKKGFPAAAARTLQAAIVEGSTEALQESIVMGVTAMSGGEYQLSEVADRLAQAFTAGGAVGGALRGSGEAGGAAINRLTGANPQPQGAPGGDPQQPEGPTGQQASQPESQQATQATQEPPAVDPASQLTKPDVATPQEAATYAVDRLSELRTRATGYTGPDGIPVPPMRLTPEEMQEVETLKAVANDPAGAAHLLGIQLRKPKGPLETALDAGAPALFPTLQPGTQVEIVDADGEIFTGVFQSEGVTSVSVVIDGERIEIPREEFEGNGTTLRPVEAQPAASQPVSMPASPHAARPAEDDEFDVLDDEIPDFGARDAANAATPAPEAASDEELGAAFDDALGAVYGTPEAAAGPQTAPEAAQEAVDTPAPAAEPQSAPTAPYTPHQLYQRTEQDGYSVAHEDGKYIIRDPKGAVVSETHDRTDPYIVERDLARARGITDDLDGNPDAALIHYGKKIGLTERDGKDPNADLTWAERQDLIAGLRARGYVSPQQNIISRPLTLAEFVAAPFRLYRKDEQTKDTHAVIERFRQWMQDNPSRVKFRNSAGVTTPEGFGVGFAVEADTDQNILPEKWYEPGKVKVEFTVYGDDVVLTNAVPPGVWNGDATSPGNAVRAMRHIMKTGNAVADTAQQASKPESQQAAAPKAKSGSKPDSQQASQQEIQQPDRPTGFTFKLADRLDKQATRTLAKYRDSNAGNIVAQIDGVVRVAEAQMRRKGVDIRKFDAEGRDESGSYNQEARIIAEAVAVSENLLAAARKAKTGDLPYPQRDPGTGEFESDGSAMADALDWLQNADAMGLPVDQVDDSAALTTRDGDTTPMPDAEIFPPVKKPVPLGKLAKESGEISLEDAQERLAYWKQVAADIGKTGKNANKVVISLFDYTGAWSQPWQDAGYQVVRHDIKQGSNILLDQFIFDRISEYREAGMEIVGVLSACPCTTFAGSGARWWADLHDVESPEAVAKVFGRDAVLTGAKSPLEYNVMLYEATRDVIAAAAPTQFHVLENPIGRIQDATGLGNPTARFNPNNFGDPYTKATQLFGPMRTDLPFANVDPVEGSKMQNKLRGSDPLGKEARSTTPQGFSYAFFMANDPDARKLKDKAPTASKPASPQADKPMTREDAEQLALKLMREGKKTAGLERDGTRWGFNSALNMGSKVRKEYQGRERGKLFIQPPNSFDAFVFSVSDLSKKLNSQQASKPVATLTGAEIEGADLPAMRKAAQRWYQSNLLGKTLTTQNGWEVQFNKRGLRKTTSKGSDLMRAIPAIPAIITKGQLVDSRDGRDSSTKAMHFLSAPVDVAGQVHDYVVAIRETKDGTFQYDLTWDNSGKAQLDADGDQASQPVAPVSDQPSLGQDVSPQPKEIKLGKGAEAPLADYSGHEVDGREGGTRDDGADAPVKETFLKDAMRYGRRVAALLQADGYTRLPGREKKSPVTKNVGGIAGSGDIYVRLVTPDGLDASLHINADSSFGRSKNGVFMNLQFRKDGKFIGSNIYPDATLPPAQLVAVIKDAAEKKAIEAGRAGTSTPTKAEIDKAAAEADPNPTPAQAEAGNYKKGRFKWNGLDLVIETAKGEERRGTAPDGTEWSVTMPAHYGDIKRTEGADGDPIDFYLGDDPKSKTVVIINQIDPDTGKFDEHKVILGTHGVDEALKIYRAGFSDGSGDKRIGSYSATDVDSFKGWLKDQDTTKPTANPTPRKITQAEWDAKHDDYKSIRADGTHVWSELDEETGATVSVPVEITDSDAAISKDFQDNGTATVSLKDGWRIVRDYGDGMVGLQAERTGAIGIFSKEGSDVYVQVSETLKKPGKSGRSAEAIADEMFGKAPEPDLSDDALGDVFDAALDEVFAPKKQKEPTQKASDKPGPMGPMDYVAQMLSGPRVPLNAPTPDYKLSKDGKKLYTQDEVVQDEIDRQKDYLPAGWTISQDRWDISLHDPKGARRRTRSVEGGNDFRAVRDSIRSIMEELRAVAYEAEGFSPETLDAANANVASQQASKPESQQADADPEEHWDAASMDERAEFFTAAGWGVKGSNEINEAAKRNIERDWADLTPTAKKKISEVIANGARARALVDDAPRSASAAAKSAASNAAEGFADLAKGLGALFGGDGTKLGSGITFDRDTYEKAKPYFIEGMKRLGAAGRDIKDMMVALITNLQQAGMTREQVANMKPYAVQFVKDVQSGAVDLAAETSTLDKAPQEDTANDTGRDQGNGDGSLEAAPRGGNQELAGGRAGAASGSGGAAGERGAGSSGTDRGGSRRGVAGRKKPDGSQGPARDRGLNAPARAGDNPGNFQIKPDFALGAGTAGQKIKANIAAIRIVKELEAENRYATPEEQEKLAAYVGWGGLATVFDPKKEGAGDQYGRAQAELKKLLTPEEYDAAHLSTRNAHYTAREIVDAMWRAMGHFGFKGGRALEPTVGTGNFLGLQPEAMANATEWYAAELDTITGLIAKHLYPDAGIMAGTGFEAAPFAEGAFDIAIGNPPFGSNTAKDPLRPDLDGMKIHNYVIAKSGLHLRPGGIMAMVVTHRFLDTADPQGRAELAKRFRFMGAVRLPNDAFKANAGTEVTTDIVFLQRLKDGEKSDPNAAWLDTNGSIEVDGQSIRVNRYFAENPTHILGRSAMDGTMYGGGKRDGTGEYTVHSDGRDLAAAIDSVIKDNMAKEAGALGGRSAELDSVSATLNVSDIPIGGMALQDGEIVRRLDNDSKGNAVTETVTPATIWAPDGAAWSDLESAIEAVKREARAGGVTEETAAALHEAAEAATMTAKGRKTAKAATKTDAAVYQLLDDLDGGRFKWAHDGTLELVSGTLGRKQLGDDRYNRLRGMLDLRARTLDLINAEKNDAPDIEDLRADLNKAYDRFQREYGYINDPANARIMQGDVGVELALESRYQPRVAAVKADPKNGIEAQDAIPSKASKADILSRRVNFPYREITSAKDAHDGLKISLSERGRLDLPYIAKLTGKTTREVIDELRAGDHPAIFFDPEANEGQGAYVQSDEYLSGNVRHKLQEAQKRGLEANIRALEEVQPEPLPRERIKPSIRGQWIPKEVFQAFLEDIGYRDPKVSIIPEIGRLSASGTLGNLTEFGQQFRDPHFSPIDLFNAAASGKALRAMVKDSDGKSHEDKQASEKSNAMAARMGKVFEEWAYSDAARADLIVSAFNTKMNTHRKRQYNGTQFLKPVGTSPSIQLRRTQKDAAWRMIQSQNVLLDHVVGAGKTFTGITGIMERKRLGLSRKPMVAVPNHLVTQWARDFYTLYPGARILAATPKDFEAKNRRRLFARIATGDYDAVIVGHSSLKHIAPPPDDEAAIIRERVGELKSALEKARREGESRRTVKQIATRVENYEKRIEELTKINRDELGIDFETMGVDYLFVDEAHEFKNLEYSTTGERVVGMNDPKGSQKAFDLYVKLRGLQARGGGVTFATGTPVSNSLVEVFTVMSYLAHDELKMRGLTNFDAWSSAYASTETRMEYTATQKLKPRRVLAGLSNLSSLGQLYDHFADVITADTLKRLYSEEIAAANKANGTNRSTRFPVPKVKGGGRQLDSAPLTEQQQTYMDYLVARMQKIEKMGGKPEYMSVDNALWVLSDARKMSLDIRTVDPTAPRDENGKVARAANRIKDIYDRWEADKGTQMVFSDLSTPAKNAAKDARKIIRDALGVIMGQASARAELKQIEGLSFQKQWAHVQAKAEEIMEADNDGALTEEIEAHFAAIEDADAAMTVADVGFSVYDDLRAVLIEKGIPANEIAFIHDYNTPEQKAQLFARVNEGSVRVLLGSSAKMGAGTNAQERLVALHHLDAPWRPSDVEQREGRIVRQGNKLYERDPEGFEVEIWAYSTEGSSDTVMWQILERKSAAIEGFRNASVDEISEDAADSDQYAEFMASSTGNPVFRYKLEAERRLNELVSETSGLLLAKSSAQRFVNEYAERTERLKTAIAALEAGEPGDITLKGETGTIAEFRAAEAKAKADYTDAYAEWLDKTDKWESAVAEAERQGEDRRAAQERLRDEGLLPGASPAEPTLTGKALTDNSAYARIVRDILTNAGEIKGDGRISFTMGGLQMRIARQTVGHDMSGKTGRYSISVALGGRSYVLETREVSNPVQSAALRRVLHPDYLASWHADELRYRKETLARLKADLPKNKALAEQEIDTTERDETAKMVDWYKAEVALAENAADLARAERPNTYITSDSKRALSGFQGVRREAPASFEVGDAVFETTGLAAAFSLSGGTVSNRALEATRKSDGARAILLATVTDKGTEIADVMVEPDRARRARNAEAKFSRIKPADNGEPVDWRKLEAAMRAELLRNGLSGRVDFGLWDHIPDPTGQGYGIGGYYFEEMLYVSLEAPDPQFVLHHETLHAFRKPYLWGRREYGAFTKAEWQMLEEHARRDKKGLAEVRELYEADHSEADMLEEVIANQYAAWRRGREVVPSGIARIFRKITDILTAMRRALIRLNIDQKHEIFEKIADGRLAARAETLPQRKPLLRRAGGYNPQAARFSRMDRQTTNTLIDAAVKRAAAIGAGGKALARGIRERASRQGASNALTDAMNMGDRGRYSVLGLVPGRPLFAELGRVVASSKVYLRLKEEMDALRNQWHARTDEVAQEWRQLIRANPAANDAMMDLMHRATIAQLDPAGNFKGWATKWHMDAAADRSLDPEMRAAAQAKVDEDKRRKALHTDLRAAFKALPPEFQDMYVKVRDTYSDLATAYEGALIAHMGDSADAALARAQERYDQRMQEIRDDDTLSKEERQDAEAEAREDLRRAKKRNGWAKKAKIAGLRAKFESNRLKGPYFPLARFGDYFVTLRDQKGDLVSFSLFETQRAQKAFIKEQEAAGFTAQAGVLSNKTELKGAVDAEFVAQVEEILGEADVPDAVMDEVWQKYLATLPDMSIRTNRLHRKNRLGYNPDAYRAFGKQVFHGAHQLARLQYAVKLDETLRKMRAEAEDAKDPNRAGMIVNEIARRHEFTMNPTGHAWSAWASSAAFLWYLAVTPSAAIVNISQTTVVGTPLLGAAFRKQGVAGASKELARALGDFTRGKGHAMDSKRLTAGEKKALEEAYRRGTVDRTQAHDLAAVAETGVEYSDFRTRWMRRASFFFHHAERLNREVTFLAAYRMARKEGMTQEAARQKAIDLTWKIHFDYQNTSRPRAMQGDTAKIILTFRNFTVNMIWRFLRDSHQALRGATPSERAEARAQLLGITASMAMHAGITGVWGFNLIMGIVGLAFDGGGDEAEERLKALLMGDGSNPIRRNMAGMFLNGIPGHVLGLSLTERLGMPSFWFRESYRDLEGRDWYIYMLEELLGPVPGIAEGMIRGANLARNGDILRGVEAAAPKFIRDGMKVVRYGSEGVLTRKGDAIIEEVSLYQLLAQLTGFTPAQVAERYKINSRMMNMQRRIEDERRELLAEIRNTAIAGEKLSDKLRARWVRWNEKYPEYPITSESVRRSISSRLRASERNEFGVQLNPKLNDRIRREISKPIYG